MARSPQLRASDPLTVLVTGGCGFIGANLLHQLAANYPAWRLVNLDALTYAGNPDSVAALAQRPGYVFEHIDLRDAAAVGACLQRHRPDLVVHLAAESHVDRSISGPAAFFESNVLGTVHLLQACVAQREAGHPVHLHHVSTDEVYGSLGDSGAFTEATPYDPSSPYAASKASSDHAVRAFHRTYGLPITLTNCSNNYGPYQFPEKLLPLMLLNALEGAPLPIYGRGTNVRDWLYVSDHCEAIMLVALRGRPGRTYNVGGDATWDNLSLVGALCDELAAQTGGDAQALRGLITFVKDRPGHDHRYAIDATRLRDELGWRARHSLAEGLRKTVRWYLDHPQWVEKVRSGALREWVAAHYSQGANS